ncbi:uncharacterized protein isoform X1 [Bombus fervidus]|uniref:uncharacterized protein isoform X1 n=1 Tax=Bombus fervidus TaxID=203811 RepID=UPI003D188220
MDQVHVKSSRSTSRSNPTKIACEKASRRLRTILVKASRLGVSTTEVAKLPSAKKLIPQRDHGWKLAVFLLVMFGGGVIVALACTARKGCSKLEEIDGCIGNKRTFDDKPVCSIDDSTKDRILPNTPGNN